MRKVWNINYSNLLDNPSTLPLRQRTRCLSSSRSATSTWKPNQFRGLSCFSCSRTSDQTRQQTYWATHQHAMNGFLVDFCDQMVESTLTSYGHKDTMYCRVERHPLFASRVFMSYRRFTSNAAIFVHRIEMAPDLRILPPPGPASSVPILAIAAFRL